ncbi:MAG: glycosyltransferase family 39 protein [bacterium]|nr:glycosyltransferase family 39 protein [bacterium]
MKISISLAVLLILAFLIRALFLDSIPTILNADEAALAYNALLLKETGYDEWGRQWPIALQSFGDQKLVGYPAHIVPLFGIFGYHDWVVRLPAAIAGTVLVLLTYILSRKLSYSRLLSTVAALLMVASPVWVFYSRTAFEAMVALTYMIAALVLLLKQHSDASWKTDVLAVGLLLFAGLTYNTPTILLPALVIAIIFWRGIKEYRRWLLPVAGMAIIAVILLSQLWQLSAQKSQITLFNDPGTVDEYAQYHNSLDSSLKPFVGSKYVFLGMKVATNYARGFSPSFILQNDDGHPWHAIEGSGYLLLSVYLLGLAGSILLLLQIIKAVFIFIFSLKREFDKKHFLLMFLLIAGFLPAAVTVDAPHATRSLLGLFIWGIMGIEFLSQALMTFSHTKSPALLSKVMITIVIFLISLEGLLYLNHYFTQQKMSIVHRPGFDKVINSVDEKYSDSDQKIIVTDDRGYEYIRTAWYLKLKPEVFFATIGRQQPDIVGLRYGERLGRYHYLKQVSDREKDETVAIEWSDELKAWRVLEF